MVSWRLVRNSFAVSCALSIAVRAICCRLSLTACALGTMAFTICNTRVVSYFNIILLLEVAYFEVSWAPEYVMCIFKQWSHRQPRHFWYRVSIWCAVCCEYSFGKYLAKECLVLYSYTVSLFIFIHCRITLFYHLWQWLKMAFFKGPPDRFFSRAWKRKQNQLSKRYIVIIS